MDYAWNRFACKRQLLSAIRGELGLRSIAIFSFGTRILINISDREQASVISA